MEVLLYDGEDFRAWLEDRNDIHIRILHHIHGPRPKVRPLRKICSKVRSSKEHNALNTLPNLPYMLLWALSGQAKSSLRYQATQAMDNKDDLPVFRIRPLAKTRKSPKHIFRMIADSGLRHGVPEPENIGIVDELQDPRVGEGLGEQVSGPVGVALLVEPGIA
jgi:hypothetical protein